MDQIVATNQFSETIVGGIVLNIDGEQMGDVNDIFGKNNSQRQFYTVPGNQVPNDQGSFAQWLYGTPKTCKEGNSIACLSQMG